MKDHRLQRLSASAPFVLAAVSLGLMAWAAWRLAQRPEIGASWSSSTGVVAAVVPGTPASNWLRPGDRILSIEGLPIRIARPLAYRRAGETVEMVIEREGLHRSVAITLISPAPSD